VVAADLQRAGGLRTGVLRTAQAFASGHHRRPTPKNCPTTRPTQCRGFLARVLRHRLRQVNGKTYVMVAGTTDLKPTGGTWLVEAKPGQTGWTEIPRSFVADSPTARGQSQISGYQGTDGKVYISADSFDRQHGSVSIVLTPTPSPIAPPGSPGRSSPTARTGGARQAKKRHR
jgi:hypothetical protein